MAEGGLSVLPPAFSASGGKGNSDAGNRERLFHSSLGDGRGEAVPVDTERSAFLSEVETNAFGEADRFSESLSPQALLRAWSFGRFEKRNRFFEGSEASERVAHAGLRVVRVDRPKLRRPDTLR